MRLLLLMSYSPRLKSCKPVAMPVTDTTNGASIQKQLWRVCGMEQEGTSNPKGTRKITNTSSGGIMGLSVAHPGRPRA